MSYNRKLFIICIIIFVCIPTLFYTYSYINYNKFYNSVLVICDNDCSDYDKYSDYIVKNKMMYPRDNDGHSALWYKGYTLFLALLKLIFGRYWGSAYIVANIFLIALLILIITFVHIKNIKYKGLPLALTVFLLLNITVLEYSRILLTDLPFSVISGFIVVLLSAGIGRSRLLFILVALSISLVATFIRPTGIYYLFISILFTLVFFLPKDIRKSLSFIIPIAVGICVMLISIIVTNYYVNNYNIYIELPHYYKSIVEQLFKFNYLGDDMFTPENRLGAIIVNFPFKYFYLNDGSLIGIAMTFIKRIPRIFELYPHFLYPSIEISVILVIFYGVLYSSFLSNIFHAIKIRKRDPEHLILIFLIIGYLLFFVSISHVTTRFRLFFDIMISISGSFSLIRFYKFFAEKLNIK